MAAPTVTVPIRADPRGFIDFARVVAKHMTALADELEQPGERISRGEFAVIVGQAFRDAGPIYDSEGPIAAVLAAAERLER